MNYTSASIPARLCLPLLFLTACGGGGAAGAAAGAPVSTRLSVVELEALHPVPSDGVAGAPLRIVLRDDDGNPLPGRRVVVDSTGNDNEFLPDDDVRTDASGRAEVRLVSTRPERKQLRVRVDDDQIELPTRPEVDFVSATVARRRVSVSSSGAEGQDFSGDAAIAADGRWVAFLSKADNLVTGDSNQKEDVFVHDRQTGVTERVSLQPNGAQFPDLCGAPSLSDDGLLVAFEGRASDTDAVFVRDRLSGTTAAISGATSLSGRCHQPRISGDGRTVVFLCDNGEWRRVFAYDRLTGALTLVSRATDGTPANGVCERPSITRDGRLVAFASIADNLVGDDSNGKYDVFVHDRVTGQTRRVSLRNGGGEGGDDSREPAIAADGRHVAFASKAENLVAGDDNGKSDVFVHDLQTGATIRVSVDPQGDEVDAESWSPQLSADGTYVVWSSLSDALAPGDSNGKEDVFRRDLVAGVTVRVSLARGGGDPDEASTSPALAADAPVVAFTSKAGNLVSSDDNDKDDVFVAPRDR
jgi:Tol biopolymer transport system component